MCWIDANIRPPDIILHDTGKTYIGSPFQGNTKMLHIATRPITVESANSRSIVERIHIPIDRALCKINSDAHDFDDRAALRISLKAVDACTGPDGLVPTSLVFGIIFRLEIPADRPALSSLYEPYLYKLKPLK